MKTIQTSQLKPNPAGKDRTKSGASESQLASEWVDIKNIGRSGVDLSGVSLFHKAFKRDGSAEWELVVRLSGVLGAGQVLRVHSGKGPFSVVRAEDRTGNDYYMFTGESRYMWNNDYGDCSLLWQPSTEVTIDEVSYDAYPPEGVVLQRVGSKLVASTQAVSRW
tara:strand:- start:39479 stop:39970 length:492 start_codon:yes stop_codon:yes gene_type:complete